MVDSSFIIRGVGIADKVTLPALPSLKGERLQPVNYIKIAQAAEIQVQLWIEYQSKEKRGNIRENHQINRDYV